MLVPQVQIDHSVADAPNGSVLKRPRIFDDRVPIAESTVDGQHQWSKQGTIRL
jgi:hypothetical protein